MPSKKDHRVMFHIPHVLLYLQVEAIVHFAAVGQLDGSVEQLVMGSPRYGRNSQRTFFIASPLGLLFALPHIQGVSPTT